MERAPRCQKPGPQPSSPWQAGGDWASNIFWDPVSSSIKTEETTPTWRTVLTVKLTSQVRRNVPNSADHGSRPLASKAFLSSCSHQTQHTKPWLGVGIPGVSDSKESSCKAGDLGSIPGWGRSPGERNGYPIQYSCLENPMNRGAWWATVCEGAKSQTQLSD